MDDQKPTELFLGIESGFYSVREAIEWADSYIVTQDFNDDVADISLATTKSRKEVLFLLANLVREPFLVPSMRVVLGRMSIELEKSEDTAQKIIQYCDQFSCQQHLELPDDMQFMVTVEDSFDMAIQGIYGTKKEVVDRLKVDLARFRKYV